MEIQIAISLFKRAKRKEHCAAATIKSYDQTLRDLLVLKCEVEEITDDDLNDLYEQLSQRYCYSSHPSRPKINQPLSLTTLHKHVRAWKTFFNWLVSAGHLRLSPARLVKRPKLPKNIPKGILVHDLVRLLRQAWQDGDLLGYALLCVLSGTACRLGGLVALTLDDVNFEMRTIMLHEKFGKSREVRLPEHAARALKRYIDEERSNDRGSNRVFIGRRGPLTGSGIYLRLKRIAEKAGVHRFNPHAFRHGFVSYALKNGANAKALQEILGHGDVRTTLMIYGAMADQEILEAHDKITFLPSEMDDLLREIETASDERWQMLTGGCRQLEFDWEVEV